MKYRVLGERTGLRVSEVGLGAWGIGGAVAVKERTGPGLAPANYGDVSEEQAIAVVHAGLERGLTFIDTAPFYGGDGVGERRIGQALRGRSEDVVVATKVGVFKEGDYYRRLFTREVVERQVEQSRRNLGRDVIDLELLHSPSREEYGNGESLDAMVDLKAAGKVRHVGVSIRYTPQQGIDFIQTGAIDVLEVPLSLLRPDAAGELLPVARRHGVGIIAREPLANGFLTGTITESTVFGPDDQRSVWPRERVLASIRSARRLGFLAEGNGRTLSQAALLWVLSRAEVGTVIAGAMRPAELIENLAVADLPPLTADDLAYVRDLQTSNFGEPPGTGLAGFAHVDSTRG